MFMFPVSNNYEEHYCKQNDNEKGKGSYNNSNILFFEGFFLFGFVNDFVTKSVNTFIFKVFSIWS